MTTNHEWDNLGRLESIANTPASSAAPMSYAYQYNDLGQRTRRTLASGDYWRFGYDGLGQVIEAEKRQSSDTPWPGFSFEWDFDDIGNRITAQQNGETATYTANPLNQYSQRTVPGVAELRGQADPSAIVTVDDGPVARVGGYFFKQLALDNSTDSLWEEITIRGVIAGAGVNNTDAVAEEYVTRWLPQTPEAFTYDDDGNLLQDGRWEYEWDGEGRLIAMETRSVAHAAGAPRERLEFVYDSQGRRVEKTHFVWDEGDDDFVESSRELFLYDGWVLLAELRTEEGATEFELYRRYVWGLDISGSHQGAGGVGGLLMVRYSDGTTLYPAYDGNSNVLGLFEPDGGEWGATYAYGAFGEPLKAVGSYADANPFRFSTKYTDDTTDLVYYGFRYYVPETGRWLNRDPIGEQGGFNLYGFVGNDGVGQWDYLGLKIEIRNENEVWFVDTRWFGRSEGCFHIGTKIKVGRFDVVEMNGTDVVSEGWLDMPYETIGEHGNNIFFGMSFERFKNKVRDAQNKAHRPSGNYTGWRNPADYQWHALQGGGAFRDATAAAGFSFTAHAAGGATGLVLTTIGVAGAVWGGPPGWVIGGGTSVVGVVILARSVSHGVDILDASKAAGRYYGIDPNSVNWR